MTTRILAADYDYLAPQTLDEALAILAEKEHVYLLAGGTDLIVKLKTGAYSDIETMLDLKHIEGLDYAEIQPDCGCLKIGCLAKLSHLEKNDYVLGHYPALAEAIHLMASIAVRNMGTLAGNVCNASPVADSVGPLIAYGAKLNLISKRGERQVAVEDYFKGPGITVKEKDELLLSISIPPPNANTGAHFIKKARVRPDIAKISITVLIERDGKQAKKCRVAMGAIAATPAFLREVGDAFCGKDVTEDLINEVALLASQSIRPIDDNRTTAEYRVDIAEVLMRDALREAWTNAGGEL